MKRIIIALVASVALMFYSFKAFVGSETITRDMIDVPDSMAIFENDQLFLLYPEDWTRSDKESDEMIKESVLTGEKIKVVVIIMPILINPEPLIKDNKGSIMTNYSTSTSVIGGKEIDVIHIDYTYDGKRISEVYYYCRIGVKTLFVIVQREQDCQIDYNLADCLTWKVKIKNDVEKNWIKQAKIFAKSLTEMMHKEGNVTGFMRIIPKKNLFIINLGRDGKGYNLERAKNLVNGMIEVMPAIKDCADHNYSFQVEATGEDGKKEFSFVLKPEDYKQKP